MQESQQEEFHNELEKTKYSSEKLGSITIALIFGLFGLWSVFAQIQMTITASGKVITHSYNKIVMHPRGGIIKKVFVEEGEFVNNNQKLLELDSSEEAFQLSTQIKKHDTNVFSICRLEAQYHANKEIDCTKYKNTTIDINTSMPLEQDAKVLFISEMRSLNAKINVYISKNNILKSQNTGLKEQIKSQEILLSSYQNELKKWKKLLKSDAVDELKIIETQRRTEQIHLQISILKFRIEENLASIYANKEQIQLEKEIFTNNALLQLNEIKLENKLNFNNIASLKHTIQNATIKSPGEGLVTDMQIHASREIVVAQKQIMSIVPDDKNLIIEAYVIPSDIEKLYKGQEAEISFPAFVDPSAVPIGGKLTYISADTITKENEKESFYVILVEITPEGHDAIKLNNFMIIPGMPAAVFVKTGKKTLMEYLIQPVIQMFKGIYHAN